MNLYASPQDEVKVAKNTTRAFLGTVPLVQVLCSVQLRSCCLKARISVNKEVNIYGQMFVNTNVSFHYTDKCRMVGCHKYMFICSALYKSVKLFPQMFV